MKPLDVLNYYKDRSTTDLICDSVLQRLQQYGEPVTTNKLVTDCTLEGIASPATTHHKLDILRSIGYVMTYNHPKDKDNRKRWIRVGARGDVYLEKWMQS
jgi:hypothetical protein